MTELNRTGALTTWSYRGNVLKPDCGDPLPGVGVVVSVVVHLDGGAVAGAALHHGLHGAGAVLAAASGRAAEARLARRRALQVGLLPRRTDRWQ